MKRGDKCLQDKQLAVVKATAAFAQISDKLLKAKGWSKVVKTKEILSSALDYVVLLNSMNNLLNNVCWERIKLTLNR